MKALTSWMGLIGRSLSCSGESLRYVFIFPSNHTAYVNFFIDATFISRSPLCWEGTHTLWCCFSIWRLFSISAVAEATVMRGCIQGITFLMVSRSWMTTLSWFVILQHIVWVMWATLSLCSVWFFIPCEQLFALHQSFALLGYKMMSHQGNWTTWKTCFFRRWVLLISSIYFKTKILSSCSLYTLNPEPSARSTVPPSQLTNWAHALTHFGISSAHAYSPQADTLEGELEGYLATPLVISNVIEFWQVFRICSFVEEY